MDDVAASTADGGSGRGARSGSGSGAGSGSGSGAGSGGSGGVAGGPAHDCEAGLARDGEAGPADAVADHERRQRAVLESLEELASRDAQTYAARARALYEGSVLAERLDGAYEVDTFFVLDVAGTLRQGQSASTTALDDAATLVEKLPRLLTMMESGRVFVPQIRTVLTQCRSAGTRVSAALDERLCAELEPDPSVWVGARWWRRVAELLLETEAELAPEETAERHERARAGRRVTARPEADGMGGLWALLPAEQLRTFLLGLEELARRQEQTDRLTGVERTADQRRADVLAMLPGLALGAGDSSRPSVVLNVQVPVATLLNRSDAPGHLDGYGPISAHHVRLLLPDAGLRQLLVDSVTGEPVHLDPTVLPAAKRSGADGARDATGTRPAAGRPRRERRSQERRGRRGPGNVRWLRRQVQWLGEPSDRPEPTAAFGLHPDDPSPADLDRLRRLVPDGTLVLDDLPEPHHDPSPGLRRFLELRDPLCTGIGCAVQSRASDMDHADPWPHGPTNQENLRPESRRCHRAKTLSWSAVREPDGTMAWTSPNGRRYRIPPPWRPPPQLRDPVSRDLALRDPVSRDPALRDPVSHDPVPPTAGPPPPPPVLERAAAGSDEPDALEAHDVEGVGDDAGAALAPGAERTFEEQFRSVLQIRSEPPPPPPVEPDEPPF